MTDSDWKARLSPEQYRVFARAGRSVRSLARTMTRRSPGTYRCAGCQTPLFRSDDKFDSGSGWPSFTDALEDAVMLRDDRSHGMRRIEAVCSTCDGHLGHLFDDGPRERGGLRYCVNSMSLDLDRRHGLTSRSRPRRRWLATLQPASRVGR